MDGRYAMPFTPEEVRPAVPQTGEYPVGQRRDGLDPSRRHRGRGRDEQAGPDHSRRDTQHRRHHRKVPHPIHISTDHARRPPPPPPPPRDTSFLGKLTQGLAHCCAPLRVGSEQLGLLRRPGASSAPTGTRSLPSLHQQQPQRHHQGPQRPDASSANADPLLVSLYEERYHSQVTQRANTYTDTPPLRSSSDQQQRRHHSGQPRSDRGPAISAPLGTADLNESAYGLALRPPAVPRKTVDPNELPGPVRSVRSGTKHVEPPSRVVSHWTPVLQDEAEFRPQSQATTGQPDEPCGADVSPRLTGEVKAHARDREPEVLSPPSRASDDQGDRAPGYREEAVDGNKGLLISMHPTSSHHAGSLRPSPPPTPRKPLGSSSPGSLVSGSSSDSPPPLCAICRKRPLDPAQPHTLLCETCNKLGYSAPLTTSHPRYPPPPPIPDTLQLPARKQLLPTRSREFLRSLYHPDDQRHKTPALDRALPPVPDPPLPQIPAPGAAAGGAANRETHWTLDLPLEVEEGKGEGEVQLEESAVDEMPAVAR